ncbi:hypothetical protein TorRG33x02_323660 [Trema orientale]|uniref:Transmembrane protein n=1 Tax=Trema orientale TaxID=63057 RepID=A0A2P5BF01_TREOI|nr:hypothetical protein TorRG33x02_323660 [Trema orientale]
MDLCQLNNYNYIHYIYIQISLCNVVLTKSSSFFLNSFLFINLRLSYKYTITTKRHSFLKQITAPKCSNAQTKRQSHYPSDTTMITITITIFIMMISLRFRTQARNLKLKQPHPLAMSEQDLSLIDQSP